MSPLFHLLITILSFNLTSAKLNVSINVIQTEDSVKDTATAYLTTPDFKAITLEITTGLSFFVIQAHSLKHPLSLYNDDILLSKTIARTDIGLVQHVNESVANYQFVLESENATSAFLFIQGYGDSAAIPGGCNLVNEPEESPTQSVVVTEDTISIAVEAAAQKGVPCEKSNVTLERYIYFLDGDCNDENAYFNQLGKLLTADGIRKHATKLSETRTNTRWPFLYNNYNTKCVLYAVIAKSGDSSSAYVTASTIKDEKSAAFRYTLGVFFAIGGITFTSHIKELALFVNVSTLMWFIVYLIGSEMGLVHWYPLVIPAAIIHVFLFVTLASFKGRRLINSLILAYFVMNMTFYLSNLPGTFYFRSDTYYVLARIGIMLLFFLAFAICQPLMYMGATVFYLSNGLNMLDGGFVYNNLWFAYKRLIVRNAAAIHIVMPLKTDDIVCLVIPLVLHIFSCGIKYKYKMRLRSGYVAL